MIDLKECIRFCIENFDSEEATERLFDFINDSLKLKEQEIELRNKIKIPNILKELTLKELTIDDLSKTIRAIYSIEYDSCTGINTILVDTCILDSDAKKIIDRFAKKNNKNYNFIYQTRYNNSCYNS